MIAVLLVGGQGTRLLPLTEWLPKPMLPIANRPFLEHQVAHLRHHGATRIILACGYKPDAIRDHFGDSLEYVVEDQPLGTGGAIAFAARDLGETFVVCNGDILTDLNLTALVAFHRSRRATATIALQPVDDPSRYGLVRTTGHGEQVQGLVRQHRPELVLLDLHLPDVDGEEVLRRLKADPRTAEVPVVVISADVNPEHIERVLAAGAREYLTKPLDVARFRAVVDSLLSGSPACPDAPHAATVPAQGRAAHRKAP